MAPTKCPTRQRYNKHMVQSVSSHIIKGRSNVDGHESLNCDTTMKIALPDTVNIVIFSW